MTDREEKIAAIVKILALVPRSDGNIGKARLILEAIENIDGEVREFKNGAGKDRTMLMKPGRFPDYR